MNLKNIFYKYEKTILFCVILMCSGIIFHDFIFGDNLFLYNDVNDDTYQSYLAAYQMVVNAVKNGNESWFNMTMGFGSNMLSFQMVILDPFAIILYICGMIWGIYAIPYALVYAQIARIVCAGLAFRYFLTAFPLSRFSRFMGAMIYAFSAFLLSDIAQHYPFATAAVGIALLLGLLEHAFQKKKIYILFSLVVAVMGIWSLYFSYMILLICGIYTLVRWLQIGELTIKGAYRFLRFPLIAVICGLMMASVLLIPEALIMMTTSDRLSDTLDWWDRIKEMSSFLSLSQMKESVARVVSNNLLGSANGWTGVSSSFNAPHLFCSILFPVAFFHYIIESIKNYKIRETKVSLFVIFITILLFFTHILGYVFNYFVDYMTRYTFVFIPFMSYLVAWYIDVGLRKKNKIFWIDWIVAIGTALFAMLMCDWTQVTSSKSALNSLFCLLVLMLLLGVLKKTKGKMFWYACIGIGAIQLVNVCYEGRLSIAEERNIITKSWYEDNGRNYAMEQILEDTNEDVFTRIERCFLGWGVQQAYTYSEVAQYYGVSWYNSLIDHGLGEFRDNILGKSDGARVAASYSFGHLGMPFDNVVADIYGIKYILSDYIVNDVNWELVKKVDEKYLYKNKSLNTVGLFYSEWCHEEEYNRMTEQERKAYPAYGVVLQDDQMEDNMQERITIPQFSVSQEFDENELYGKEVVLELNNNWDEKENKQVFLSATIFSKENGQVKIMCDTGFGFSDIYWAQDTFELNANEENNIFVKIPIDTKNVKLVFDGDSETIIDHLSIETSLGCNYTNENLSLSIDHTSGKISGQINAENKGILMIPICVNEGWEAWIDGQETDILKADYAFMAIEIDEGEHFIELKYHTPGFRVGMVISLAGIVLWFGMVVIGVLKYNKKHGNKLACK